LESAGESNPCLKAIGMDFYICGKSGSISSLLLGLCNAVDAES